LADRIGISRAQSSEITFLQESWPVGRTEKPDAIWWRLRSHERGMPSKQGRKMPWAGDDIRQFVEQLTAASREGRGAKLMPRSVNIALAALRAYRDRLTTSPVTAAIVSFSARSAGDRRRRARGSCHTREVERRFTDQEIGLQGRPAQARELIRPLQH
jgi:hypothetical protein